MLWEAIDLEKGMIDYEIPSHFGISEKVYQSSTIGNESKVIMEIRKELTLWKWKTVSIIARRW